MSDDKYRLTFEQRRAIYTRIASDAMEGADPVEAPRVIIAIGQPGTQLSRLVSDTVEEFKGEGGCVVMNPELMSRYHTYQDGVPRLAAEAVVKLAETRDGDVNAWMKSLLEESLASNRNLVIQWPPEKTDLLEQTLSEIRTHSPHHGIEFRAIAEKRLISESRAQDIGERTAYREGYVRIPTGEQHAAACLGVAKAVSLVERDRCVDELGIYDGQLKLVYGNRLDETGWVHPQEGRQFVDEMQAQRLTGREYQDLRARLCGVEDRLESSGRDFTIEDCVAVSDLRQRASDKVAPPRPEECVLGRRRNDEIFERQIKPYLLKGGRVHGDVAPQDTPRMIMLGAQPGARTGISHRSALAELAHPDGALVIGHETLCRFHPMHTALLSRDDRTAHAATHADVARWVEKALAFARENRFNVLLDTHMEKPDAVAATLAAFRKDGYATEVRVVAVHERASRMNMMDEMLAQRARGFYTRPVVGKEAHDTAYAGVQKSLERIESERLADRVRVNDEEGKRVFGARAMPGGAMAFDQTQERASKALEAERHRPWTFKEWETHTSGLNRIDALAQKPPQPATMAEWAGIAELRKASVAARALQEKPNQKPGWAGPTR